MQYVIGILIVIAAVWISSRFWTPPYALLSDRVPAPDRWQKLYPPEQQPRVLAVLDCLCDSFLLRSDDRFRLQPSDRLRDLYAAAYPNGGADTLEFEHLRLALTEEFRVPEQRMELLLDATVSDVLSWCLSQSNRNA
jgi:hypothetical protein